MQPVAMSKANKKRKDANLFAPEVLSNWGYIDYGEKQLLANQLRGEVLFAEFNVDNIFLKFRNIAKLQSGIITHVYLTKSSWIQIHFMSSKGRVEKQLNVNEINIGMHRLCVLPREDGEEYAAKLISSLAKNPDTRTTIFDFSLTYVPVFKKGT